MHSTVKKILIVCVIAAFGAAITVFGVALGLLGMAKYDPAQADELLAHESDHKQPHAESTMISTTLPPTSKSVTGNPAGANNLNDGTTRTEKSDHFDAQKSEMNKTVQTDEATRNPALAVQEGMPVGEEHP